MVMRRGGATIERILAAFQRRCLGDQRTPQALHVVYVEQLVHVVLGDRRQDHEGIVLVLAGRAFLAVVDDDRVEVVRPVS
eukprot:6368666-Pyramimonas_sp.AAC.1